MKLEPLSLPGMFLLTPEPITDARGFFARTFSRDALAAAGLCADFPEWSLSHNVRQGTLRGLHWQAAPSLEVKLVQCIRGAVFDVAVDVRPDSMTRGRWHAVELSADNRRSVYIPAGFAHGFQTLCDDTEIMYHISASYRHDAARGVRWDDPEIAISWPPARQRIISERDASLPYLAAVGKLA